MKFNRISKPARAVAATLLLLGLVSPLGATQVPIPPPPQVETLRVVKQTSVSGTRLSWTGGSGPYVGVRSQTLNFLNSPTLFYVSRGIAASPLDDANTLSDANSYFYQINDVNTYPEVYTDTSLTDYVIGDVVTLDGANFSSGSTHVYIEGIEVPTTSVSSSQIQFNVPASVPSGNVIVQCASGLTTTRKISVVYFKNHADLTHVAVDNNHDAWVVERGTAPTSDRNYKINHTTGTVSPFVTINEPVGQPHDSANNQYSCNSLVSATNTGTIRMTSPTGAQSNFPISACTGGTPCYCRALAINPANNAPGTLTVYFMDANSGFIKAVTNAGRSNYQNVGLSMPNPGGIDIDAAGKMFYTQDANTVPEIVLATHAPVFTYNAAFGISNPAQIHVENNRRIWVANRGGNNILRISTDPTEPPGPASRKVIAKYTNLASPRGIAVDHDPTIDPTTGLSYTWAYVAEQTKFSKFRVYDTVWVNINVLNEAMNSPTANVADTNPTDMTARIMKDFNAAHEIFKQAGIELRLRGINYIADPNAHSGTPSTTSPRPGWLAFSNSGLTMTSEQTTLFGTARSSTQRDINIYYVLSAWDITAATNYGINGYTYTNDIISGMNNFTQSAIVITRYWYNAAKNVYTLRDNITTMAHELSHFLINGTATYEHNVQDKTWLMWPIGGDAYKMDSGHINNMQTNPDESVFIDRF